MPRIDESAATPSSAQGGTRCLQRVAKLRAFAADICACGELGIVFATFAKAAARRGRSRSTAGGELASFSREFPP